VVVTIEIEHAVKRPGDRIRRAVADATKIPVILK